MEDIFLLLEQLHAIDSGRQSSLDLTIKIPAEMKRLQGRLDAEREKLKKQQLLIDNLSKEKAGLEKEIGDKKNEIQATQGKIPDIKTHQEYQAAIREITNWKRDIKTAEDKMVGCLELVEKEQEVYKGIELEYNSAAENVNAELEGKNKELESAKIQLSNTDSDRNVIVDQIPKKIYLLYERVRDLRKTGISYIVNKSCSVCYMALPPQLINEVLATRVIHQCPSCKRILVTKSQKEEVQSEGNQGQ